MTNRPPLIDMRLDGSFQQPPRAGVPLSAKLVIGSVLVAVVGGAVAMAALAVWVLSMILPIIVGAAVFAWATMRFRRWQAGRGRGGTSAVGPWTRPL